ncbi:hypothetical protein GGTG_12952 [Gaeumannomyces tritici R3-111a-1]|uniref:Uncharacterized protein n=1 Tax=Gaeumannomyces tritici (strain R3-111a-1) TaxID=644352 RepID=J3PHH2_GAET3|nr:hypothetical protein GGTG_12952 [Gaeumannomyces tritici R3-111a-1]EJT69333.1 hypothetical protein GGTG_12952 [Gaeumannomyces tritici R3-111a-1]
MHIIPALKENNSLNSPNKREGGGLDTHRMSGRCKRPSFLQPGTRPGGGVRGETAHHVHPLTLESSQLELLPSAAIGADRQMEPLIRWYLDWALGASSEQGMPCQRRRHWPGPPAGLGWLGGDSWLG